MRRTPLITLVAVAALTGCTAQTPSSSQQTSSSAVASAASSSASSTAQPAPLDPQSVELTNPDAVAEAVAISSVTYDTSTQPGPYDAMRALSALLTTELAAMYPEPAADAKPSVDAIWAQARDIGAYNIPAVTTAQPAHGQPADTGTHVYRYYEATWTWYGEGGKTIHDGSTHAIYITVDKQADDTWLVSQYDTTAL